MFNTTQEKRIREIVDEYMRIKISNSIIKLSLWGVALLLGGVVTWLLSHVLDKLIVSL